MNSRDRMMNVVNKKKMYGVPSGFWLHFPMGFEAGEASVVKHLEFLKESESDICKVMNENSLTSNPQLNTAADWGRLRPIDPQASFIQRQVELVRRVCEEAGDKAVVLATVHGMVASSFHYLGGGELYDYDKLALTRHFRENPEAFLHGMRVIYDYLDYLCEACLKAGADGLYFASLGGEVAMMDDDEFERFFKPFEIRLLEKYEKVPCANVLHMCKDHLNLNRYLGYPQSLILNWGVHEHNLSLAEGKKLFGEDRIILGGMDDRAGVLVNGTVEEIHDTVYQILEENGTENMILGADCTLPTDVELWRVREAARAARDYQ